MCGACLELDSCVKVEPDFMGLGHQLEQKRKERRRIEMEERAVANRVLFLEK